MDLSAPLSHVRNDEIEFATMRPPGSPFATLDRRVVVTGPARLAELARLGDPRILDELVALLRQPDRAWAAAVLLAAMTGRDSKVVESFATTPDRWWDAVGRTAHEQWSAWLDENRERLAWDQDRQIFSTGGN